MTEPELIPVPKKGDKVMKLFSGDPYRGTVSTIDIDEKTGKQLFHIKYDDSDEEDLELDECRRVIGFI